MKLLKVIFLLFWLANIAQGQPLKYYQTGKGAKVIRQAGDTLYDPWNGGLLNPQFSNIDLDQDGHQDLFVFDRGDDKVLTFIDEGDGAWVYAPEYAAAFPTLENFALLVDYDRNGRADIFTYSSLGAGFDVYRNISANGKPAFQRIARQLSYEDFDFRSNIYVPSSDIPAIVDVDGDNDIDILAYDVVQMRVIWYRNRSIEKYGKPDSLDFKIADFCWGKFEEPLDTIKPVTLGISCGKVKKRAERHAGSTLLAFDADGDGDMDVLLGDLGKSNLVFLENGRIQGGVTKTESDSMIRYEVGFPKSGTPANVPLFPATFMVDVDADGKKDIVVTPQAVSESAKENLAWLYRNSGTNAKPVFQFSRKDFLMNQSLSFGSYSASTFLDYDGDGLLDMIVAGKGNPQPVYSYGTLTLFHNVGTSEKPIFQKVKDDLTGVQSKQIANLMPASADLNGDGKQDLILGQENGKLLFYKNTGLSGGLPQFTFQTDAFAGIDVGNYSAPAIADLNRDGLLDLVVGELRGTLHYFRNTGTTGNPAFTEETDFFGHVRTNRFFYSYEYDTTGKPIDSTRYMEPNGYSAPTVSDLDNDSKWDLIVGSAHGRLFSYLDIESHLPDSFIESAPIVYNQVYGQYTDPDFGFLSAPSSVDLDGDNKAEIIVGNYRGGLNYLASKYIPLSVQPVFNRVDSRWLNIYPNPSHDIISVYFSNPSHEPVSVFDAIYSAANLQIVNSIGQSVHKQKFEGRCRIDISHLPDGIYYLIVLGEGGFASGSFIVR
jgi:hypothetical protein